MENKRGGAHVMSSVEKLDTMLLMKFSRMMTARMAFQSVAFSPRSRQMDSKATLTSAGGLPIDLTSTKCCFFILFTAVQLSGCAGPRRVRHHHEARAREYKKREKQKRHLAAFCIHTCGGLYGMSQRYYIAMRFRDHGRFASLIASL